MSSYRCFFLDAANRVAAPDFIDCDTDGETCIRADVLLAASSHIGVDVWDRGRQVYRARKSRSAPDAEIMPDVRSR